MAATKRAQPATHPTVYVGLALAAIGLLLSMYAYTGARIYDVAFALVALGGALLAVLGIFTAAWGRAIMSARAQRSRRAAIQEDAVRAAEEGLRPLPTVAEPPQKKRFGFAGGLLSRRKKTAEPEQEAPVAKGGAFAFRRRSAPPPPPAPPAEPTPAPTPVEAAPAEAAPTEAVTEAAAEPALERVTLRCPRCTTEFSAEGVRPFPIACPSCGLTATV